MSTTLGIDDRQLLLRLKTGDVDAYELLYHRYKGLLYLHAYKRLQSREEVKDMIHEVFLDFWEKREVLEITNNLSAYLYQSVRYKIINHFNKAKLAQQYLDSLTTFSAAYSSTTDYMMRENMLKGLIEKEIERLPAKMRHVFELSRNEGLTHKQIACMLNLSEQSVRSHIKNALRILRLKLGIYLLLAFLFRF
ncbi:hypothetical protein DBR43_09915 [Pedobacter sp. KBW06]|uniref:RNA polymerase sigma factor n=1 Tax=Pedobacter sp. KBW06 TaxID=2153359 RepID=UPI000F5B8374|nr:RNA polymerase sigma-70 factor [Pedobacter sp. KBW06]RQO75643.1 hypothetical protein DBR43_09915 [Pedobacter sp. KBW06]